MKRSHLFLAVICCVAASISMAQVQIVSELAGARPETMAEYPGGEGQMIADIMSVLSYPHDAKESAVSGKVIISFVVDTLGGVTDVSLVRGIQGADSLNEEVVKAVSQLKAFSKPATLVGKPVPAKMYLPVYFEISR